MKIHHRIQAELMEATRGAVLSRFAIVRIPAITIVIFIAFAIEMGAAIVGGAQATYYDAHWFVRRARVNRLLMGNV